MSRSRGILYAAATIAICAASVDAQLRDRLGKSKINSAKEAAELWGPIGREPKDFMESINKRGREADLVRGREWRNAVRDLDENLQMLAPMLTSDDVSAEFKDSLAADLYILRAIEKKEVPNDELLDTLKETNRSLLLKKDYWKAKSKSDVEVTVQVLRDAAPVSGLEIWYTAWGLRRDKENFQKVPAASTTTHAFVPCVYAMFSRDGDNEGRIVKIAIGETRMEKESVDLPAPRKSP